MPPSLSKNQLRSVKKQVVKTKKEIESNLAALEKETTSQTTEPTQPQFDVSDRETIAVLVSKGVKVEDITREMIDSMNLIKNTKSNSQKINKSQIASTLLSNKENQQKVSFPYQKGDLVLISESMSPTGKEMFGVIIDIDEGKDQSLNNSSSSKMNVHSSKIMTSAGIRWFTSKGLRKIT